MENFSTFLPNFGMEVGLLHSFFFGFFDGSQPIEFTPLGAMGTEVSPVAASNWRSTKKTDICLFGGKKQNTWGFLKRTKKPSGVVTSYALDTFQIPVEHSKIGTNVSVL